MKAFRIFIVRLIMSDGLEKDWNYVGSKRTATYTSLPAGDYVFMVKASNNDGIWNDNATRLCVEVLPPWWKTWWFRISIVAVIVFTFILLYRYRVKTLKRQNIELEEKVLKRTIELQNANLKLKDKQIEIEEKSNFIQEVNIDLEERQEEILVQKSEIEAQRDNINLQNEELQAANATGVKDVKTITASKYHFSILSFQRYIFRELAAL